MADMIAVKSSSVTHIGHDADKGELHVTFPGGKTWIYEGVDAAHFAKLQDGRSIGSHVQTVLKPNHKARRA